MYHTGIGLNQNACVNLLIYIPSNNKDLKHVPHEVEYQRAIAKRTSQMM